MISCSKKTEIRRCRPLLGTFVEITAGGLAEAPLQAAAAEAFQAVEQVQRLMSFYDETSDVTRLNRFAFRKPVKVHPWTYRVFKAARRISLKTAGLFDVTVAPLLMKWGHLPPLAGLPANTAGTFRDLELLSGGRVRFRVPLAVDLGGIAKGFAVDQAVKKLRQLKVPYGSVNAGGDLRVFGGKAQPVYVRNPANPGQMILLAHVRETAVASSARYFTVDQKQDPEASSFAHPENRMPAKKTYGVTVFSKTCMLADALTKPVMIEDGQKMPWMRGFSAQAVKIHPDAHGGVYFDAA